MEDLIFDNANEEIKKSWIWYELTIPNIVRISLTFIIIMVVLFISYFFIAPYERNVKFTGEIISAANDFLISNIESGIVQEKKFFDGMYVEKGTLLLSFKNQDIYEQISICNEKKKSNEKELFDLREAIKYLKEIDTNLRYSGDFGRLKKDDLELFRLYKEYEYKRKQYDLNKDLCPEFISEMELLEINNEYLFAKINYDNYYLKVLTDYELEALEKESELDELNTKLITLEFQKSRTEFRSEISGFVYELMPISVGQIITGSNNLMKIIPSSNSNLDVTFWVPSKEIAEIMKGMIFNVNFPLYPETLYSVLSGEIFEIQKEVDRFENGDNYFLVKGHLSATKIIKRSSKKEIQIIPGMKAIIKVKTEKRKLYEYIFEKIV